MIVVSTFNGTPINDGTVYKAGLPGEGDAFARGANPIVLSVIGGFPRYEGNDPQSIQFPVEIELVQPTKANIDALNLLFRVGGKGEFVVIWDGETRVRDCAVVSFHPMSGSVNKYVVMLLAADPRWREAVQSTQAGSIVSSGTSFLVHQNGNAIDDKPVITITPVTQKTAANSFLYRRYAVCANRVARALTDWPIDLTNYISTGPSGGLDHAALVTAGKSQAAGADVRVLVDGIESPRYFGENANTDPNSARTTVWTTPIFSASLTAHLYAAITNVSPANGGELEVLRGEVRPWPKQGYLVNPTSGEVFAYSGWTEANANGRAAFTGIKRARFGTTAASGSANDTLYRVERKLELIYGHTGIAAPEARPDVKPILNLASATISNLRHEWIDFYDDTYPARPAQWARVREYRDGDTQTGYLYLPQGSPASAITFTYQYTQAPANAFNYNTVRRAIPVGTAGASGQFGFAFTLGRTLLLKPFGVDAAGVERLMSNYTEYFGVATSSLSFSTTQTPKLYEVGAFVRSATVYSVPQLDTGESYDGFTQWVNPNVAGNANQLVKAIHSEAMQIWGVDVMLGEGGTPKRAVDLYVMADDGSGNIVTTSVLAHLTIGTGSFPDASPHWVGGFVSPGFMFFPNESLHIDVEAAAINPSSSVVWEDRNAVYANKYPIHAFRMYSSGEIDPVARGTDGDQASIDNAFVVFDSATTPYFALTAEAACYWLNGTLTNTTTQQSIKFGLFVSPNDQIQIDVGARTVTNLTTGETGLLYGIDPSDDEAWISIVPGDNVLQWTETGCQRVDFSVAYFDRWE